eukprot:CAMPEP_0172193680 /NCGR_PEP_ID=MMETSP1050-20130122/25109_1 /TAXON_ID=233186 /ORGANISM="Cryptomonas curvata, Strain CCAP979/52" /LENGTH=177 /DNA_ID=CAMNT_0012869303 /DNA_START=57 /DNA_END=586 /DNA_ORIENTATION=-
MSISLRLEPILSFFPCLVERGQKHSNVESTQQSPKLASTLQEYSDEAIDHYQIEVDNEDRYSLQTMPDPYRKDILIPAIKLSRRRIELSHEHDLDPFTSNDRCDAGLDQEDFSVDRTHDAFDYVAVMSARKKLGKPAASPPQLEQNEESATSALEAPITPIKRRQSILRTSMPDTKL